MKTYRVKWEIDLDAHNPRAAAEKALEIMRDPESIATVFEITQHGSADTSTVDLLDLDEDETI